MSLTQRYGDLKLAVKLLFWGWFIFTPLCLLGAAWLMAPDGGLSLAWRGYLSARLADFAGLGQIPFIPIGGGTLVKPADILAWSSENIPTATLADWDSNFQTLGLIPLITALGLSLLVSAIHLYRKKGTSK